MTGRPLVFVDVETTGLGADSSRILEVGAVRVENGRVVKTVNQLVFPGVAVPGFITNLTHITDDDVRHAPSFCDVAEDLKLLFGDAVFVAHNVAFDYSFFVSEFKRLGEKFSVDRFCTARLSRLLSPHHRHHNLDAVIERGGYKVAARHRAYDDAVVLHQFYSDALRSHGTKLEEYIMKIFIPKDHEPPGRRVVRYIPC